MAAVQQFDVATAVWEDAGVSELPVSRAELMSALAQPEAADQACRAAIALGAGFRVWPAPVPAGKLVVIYDRRVRHLAARGIASIGSETVVGRLRAVAGGSVRLGVVHSGDFNFNLFLDVHELRVLACVGVAASAANPDSDWSFLTS